MRILAYLYSDPLLEPTPDPLVWGWEVDRVYQDQAIGQSAIKGSKHDRPQWQQCMQDCQSEPADYLLVRRLEELGDSVQEVSDRLAQLEALEIQLLAIEQSVSLTIAETAASSVLTANSIQANLLRLLQHLQREQRSRRIRQGHARNRIKALPPPGKAPYGYRRSQHRYVIDRATAPVVKEFFDQFLLYGSVRGAVRYLAKKYNKAIAVSTGHRWLMNPAYRGDLVYHNGEIVPDTHQAIISREEAAQVDRLLRRNRRLPPRTASAPRSLAGLVVCQDCRSPLTVARVATPRQQREYLYLRPSNCPRQPKCSALAYEDVLQETIQHICTELPTAVAGMTSPDMDGIKQGIQGAIATKQTILEQLAPLVSNGILDQDTADLRAYKLRTELAVLQDQLAQLPPVNLQSIAQAVSIPQFWLDLSETERRFYLREFIRQIEVVRQPEIWNLKLVFIF
jgi:DNA invertase Pin-like site-specific DNA recombinase